VIASNTYIHRNAEPSWLKCSVRNNIFVGREVQGWMNVYNLVPPNAAIMGRSGEARKIIAYDEFVITYNVACYENQPYQSNEAQKPTGTEYHPSIPHNWAGSIRPQFAWQFFSFIRIRPVNPIISDVIKCFGNPVSC
jgi:hypothetical protein